MIIAYLHINTGFPRLFFIAWKRGGVGQNQNKMAEKTDINNDLVSFLVNNVEKPLYIMNQTNTEGDGDPVWGKSLAKMPMFTLREIQKHREMCGKGNAIIKVICTTKTKTR